MKIGTQNTRNKTECRGKKAFFSGLPFNSAYSAFHNIYRAAILIVLFVSQGWAKDIYVSQGGSIGDAVISSGPGDKVIIKKGSYKESGIIIDKPIEVTGEDYPEIDGMGKGEIFTVRSDNVTIKGIKLINCGYSSMKDFAALKIENASGCRIEQNKLLNNFFGIYLAGSKKCEIISNEIISNAVSEISSGNGIHLWKCDSILVSGNIITGHRDGIYFEFVTHSKVLNNRSEKNIRYGLHFMFSNYDDYENNVFKNNGAGVAVMYTRYVKMINNRFEDNWGPNAYGLLLKDISDALIQHNMFHKNTTGLYSEGGTRINILNNTFSENGWASKILGNCTDDTVKLNNFIGNTFDVSTNSSRNTNLFSENYWDKYNGYDLNKDGAGDVPFRPVSMFSMVVEETPASLFLLRSFIVELLDVAEKVVPVFIPESLIDERPRMSELRGTK
ncbi:MAG TPA: nitrous oxide reductase family maturation protein NosD [Ignavibacteria bacterium]